MNPYVLSLASLIIGLLAQALASGLSLELAMRGDQKRSLRLAWLVLAAGSLCLALAQGYALELALRTGLYDLRQAVLGGIGGIFFALGVIGRRCNA